MKTIALRFGEHFAPECGTIAAHQQMIDKNGFVWYGKMGNTLSDKTVNEIMQYEAPKILLIQSGKMGRHWANICEIKKQTPPLEEIPEYYRENSEKFKCWFKVTSFEDAPRNILGLCHVASSGASLSEVSRHSMSPYFIIEYEEGGD